MVLSIRRSKVRVHLRIIEIHVIFLDIVWRRVTSSAITFDSGLKFLEFHNIARQSTSFVRKYVFHLSELLIQIGGLGLHTHVLLGVIHRVVYSHKRCMPKLDELKSYRQGDWHEISEDQEPCTEILDQII